MLSSNSIYYIAGILEGEGSFQVMNQTPSIALNMTDEDIVKNVRNIMAKNRIVYHHDSDRPNTKRIYRLTLHGTQAVQWMMTLYSLMGVRRKEQIRKVLNHWKQSKQNSRVEGRCHKGHMYTRENRDFKYTMSGVKICLHCRRQNDKLRNRKLA